MTTATDTGNASAGTEQNGQHNKSDEYLRGLSAELSNATEVLKERKEIWESLKTDTKEAKADMEAAQREVNRISGEFYDLEHGQYQPRLLQRQQPSNGSASKAGAEAKPKLPIDHGAAMPIEELAKHRLDGEGDEFKPITKGKCEALRESSLEIGTVGKLETVMRENPHWHRDVRGFGESWIDRLTNSLTAFRAKHPVPGGDDTAEKPQSDAKGPVRPEPKSGDYPDRNGPGGEDCGTVAQRVPCEFPDQDAEVQVSVGIAKPNVYVSSIKYRIGRDEGGRDVPRKDSEPFETANGAARAALTEFADLWSRAGGKRAEVAPLLIHWRDDAWPAEAPDDVPFGE